MLQGGQAGEFLYKSKQFLFCSNGSVPDSSSFLMVHIPLDARSALLNTILHSFLTRASSAVTFTAFISSLIRSIQRFFGLPRGLLPPRSNCWAVFATEFAMDNMTVPSEPLLSHLEWHSPLFPDVFIHHSVELCETQSPPQHLELHCVKNLLMLGHRWPTL